MEIAQNPRPGALLAEAENFDTRFTRFEDFADSLTDQFWAQHYPGGDLTGLGANYLALRQQAGELAALIEEQIVPRLL